MGKVGETNHKIPGERTDCLLCLWLTQSLVARGENPRKQLDGLQCAQGPLSGDQQGPALDS